MARTSSRSGSIQASRAMPHLQAWVEDQRRLVTPWRACGASYYNPSEWAGTSRPVTGYLTGITAHVTRGREEMHKRADLGLYNPFLLEAFRNYDLYNSLLSLTFLSIFLLQYFENKSF